MPGPYYANPCHAIGVTKVSTKRTRVTLPEDVRGRHRQAGLPSAGGARFLPKWLARRFKDAGSARRSKIAAPAPEVRY